jgi:hypothetical protein
MSLFNTQSTLAQTHAKDVTFKNQMGTNNSRDPFSLPSGVYLLQKEGEKAESTQVNRLSEDLSAQNVKAILISKRLRLALIDHHIVSIGDSIRDEKVTDIKPDYVILTKGDKKRILFLYKNNIPLKIDRN